MVGEKLGSGEMEGRYVITGECVGGGVGWAVGAGMGTRVG